MNMLLKNYVKKEILMDNKIRNMYSILTPISIEDERFKNINFKELTKDGITEIREILYIDCNDYLNSLPYDYYLILTNNTIVMLKTLTKLRETSIYNNYQFTNSIFISETIDELDIIRNLENLIVYQNIICYSTTHNNQSYFSIIYIVSSKNMVINDILDQAVIDLTCSDLHLLTDFRDSSENKIYNMLLLPDVQNKNKLILSVRFKTKDVAQDKRVYNFLFKHDNSKFLKLKLLKIQ